MKITITGRKCSPRDSFKEHAEKKLERISKFFGDECEAKITVTVEKSSQIVEITINNKSMVFRAEEKAANMNEALDKSVDTLIRQIRKNKTKLEKKMKHGSFDIISDEDLIPDESEYDVVRKKSVILKPLSVDEAILQMNLIGHQFFMFINEDDNEITVVYKRNDGGYGLLTPEIH